MARARLGKAMWVWIGELTSGVLGLMGAMLLSRPSGGRQYCADRACGRCSGCRGFHVGRDRNRSADKFTRARCSYQRQ